MPGERPSGQRRKDAQVIDARCSRAAPKRKMTMLSPFDPRSSAVKDRRGIAVMNRFRSLRVLVVDATPSMAQALCVILIENGHYASPAFSAAEALVLCHHRWPDVVIVGTLSEPQEGTQLAMDVMSGHPECRVLRISDDLLPSAHSQHARSIDRNLPGLTKPINSRAILSYLNDIDPPK